MLKDLGTIALFLGVVLNAYHYYKLHTWSKKEKNFDLIIKIVNDLKDIRNRVFEIEKSQYKYSKKINQYNHSVISIDEFGEQIPKLDGFPSQNLCYKINKFEQKAIKIYEDYIFIIKFKKSIQADELVDVYVTEKFILDIENEIKNRLYILFTSFCQWDKTIDKYYGGAFQTMKYFCDCEDLDKLFKGVN